MAEHDFSYAESLKKVEISTPQGVVECVGGSYAGIPFFIEESGTSGGREVISKALPFSNNHVNEDGGRKVMTLQVKFYIVGPDCESQRDKLEEAFNKEGYFELVHPQYGKFNARCPAYTVSYKQAEMEYIEGEATFVPEHDPKKTASSVTDLRGVTISKSDSALDRAKAVFTKAFKMAGKAKAVVDSVADYTNKVLDDIDVARGGIRNVSAFVNTISQIRDNVQLIMMTPADFANRLQNLLTMVKETFGPSDGNEYVNESLTMMDKTVAKRQTSAFTAANEMDDCIDLLVLMSSAAMAARSVVDSDFESAEDARLMQDRVSASFDAAAASVDSVDDYADLVDMQAAALKYLRDTMSRLAVVVDLPMNGTRDALSVCFDVYGSLDRVDEIIGRNKLGDPLVITRSNLRVLSK